MLSLSKHWEGFFSSLANAPSPSLQTVDECANGAVEGGRH